MFVCIFYICIKVGKMNYKQLYQKLLEKRNELKTMFVENGRTPTICSDQALYELAVAAPRTKQDLANVNGLGETFVQKYGDYFMEVLDEYHKQKVSVVPYSDTMREAVKRVAGRAETECSGNVTKERLAEIADIGVDYVSSGAITYSAPIMDISLKNLVPTE